jgi:hypothetical protein
MSNEDPNKLNELAMEACRRLTSTIESTGGVIQYPSGLCAPTEDPEWIDLGDAYMTAKQALGETVERPKEDHD